MSRPIRRRLQAALAKRAVGGAERVVGAAERVVVGVLVASMTVLVAIQVVARHIFDSPLVWTDEAARFTLVWLTFLGAALLALEKGHVAVDLFAQARLSRFRPVVEVFAAVAQIVVCGVLTYAAVRYWTFLGDTKSPALRVPMQWVFVSATLGFGLWTAHTVIETARGLGRFSSWRGWRNGRRDGRDGDAEQHGAL